MRCSVTEATEAGLVTAPPLCIDLVLSSNVQDSTTSSLSLSFLIYKMEALALPFVAFQRPRNYGRFARDKQNNSRLGKMSTRGRVMMVIRDKVRCIILWKESSLQASRWWGRACLLEGWKLSPLGGRGRRWGHAGKDTCMSSPFFCSAMSNPSPLHTVSEITVNLPNP